MPAEPEDTEEVTVTPDEVITDPTEIVADVITGPRSATVDGVTTSQHSTADLIAAAKFLAAQKAAKKNHRGLRFTKLVPPGAFSAS